MNSSFPKKLSAHMSNQISASSSLKRLRQLSPRWLIGIGLFGLLLIAAPAVKQRLAAQSETVTQTEESLPVETVPVAREESYEVSRAYTGEIASVQASELGFERSGQLIELLCQKGRRYRPEQLWLG